MTPYELNIVHPVGSIYETLDASFDPNVTWGGTWSNDTSGTILVSRLANDSSFGGSTGTIVGSDTASAAWPTHSHDAACTALLPTSGTSNYSFTSSGVYHAPLNNDAGSFYEYYGNGTWYTNYKGGGQTHDNRMKYKTVKRWIRTA